MNAGRLCRPARAVGAAGPVRIENFGMRNMMGNREGETK